ncbi:MAG: ferrochelatase [Gammaproteobacteria bacterium]|nr:ferrochelatase [Gammaproteobacteria bacterium]MCY4218295.1 ferrochelatase [Gammaproteobacteria bacterium]MCY4276049.1 ferrochelatase [Gammaproteobacteria bacterium]
MTTDSSQRTPGILLSNLGTPDSPEVKDVRRYLKQFLSDKRVIKLWKPLWWLILNLIILRTRPARSAQAYSKIWTDEGSPLLVESRRQLALLRKRMPSIPIELGMRYGNPSIQSALEALHQQGVNHFVVLGLYPQFSYTTISSVKDEVLRFIEDRHTFCSFSMICDYHDHDSYIETVSGSIQNYQDKHGRADRLLMSFHGIPKKYAEDGDPYPEQCRKSANLIADRLQLENHEWSFSFQSRLGPTEWLKPYTDETLEAWGKEGVKSIQVVCPGFSVDCLETLEEIAMENSFVFQESGGGHFSYIPCLNSSTPHIEMMIDLIDGKLK